LDKKEIELLYEYNRWANDRILNAASKLTTDQFVKDLSNSHPSVRDTLTHILSAEWIWLMRWQGISPKTMLDSANFPTVSSLRTKWAAVEKDQMDFIRKVTDESLGKVIVYTNPKGEERKYLLQHMMQHVVNHSSYHRGQVVTMLRQLGVEAIDTDFIVFINMKMGML
jgi:uncharacterized damage-inducible protein DinB